MGGLSAAPECGHLMRKRVGAVRAIVTAPYGSTPAPRSAAWDGVPVLTQV
jgi:hypothetical protein